MQCRNARGINAEGCGPSLPHQLICWLRANGGSEAGGVPDLIYGGNLTQALVPTTDIVEVSIRSYSQVYIQALREIARKDFDCMKRIGACHINLIRVHRVNPAIAVIHEEILAHVRTWKSEGWVTGAQR